MSLAEDKMTSEGGANASLEPLSEVSLPLVKTKNKISTFLVVALWGVHCKCKN